MLGHADPKLNPPRHGGLNRCRLSGLRSWLIEVVLRRVELLKVIRERDVPDSWVNVHANGIESKPRG